MQRNSIPWGLLVLSLLCGGALTFETASTARAGASQTPWGTIVATVPGYANPVVINPKTNAVYFIDASFTQIVVLDGKTNQFTATIPVPADTNSGWFDVRQDLLYAQTGGFFSSNPSVTIIDAKTNSVIKTIPLVPPPSVPANSLNRCCNFFVVNPATGKVYAAYDLESSNSIPGNVAVWDLATGAALESIQVQDPQGAAINTKTNRVYVADNFKAQLLVVDGVSNKVIDKIQVGQAYFPDECYLLTENGYEGCLTQGSGTTTVAVSEKTNRIYVGDFTDGTLYVIDGATDKVIAGPIVIGQGLRSISLDEVHDAPTPAPLRGSAGRRKTSLC